MLTAVLRLVLAIVRVSRSRLELARLPAAGNKRIIINAVERARQVKHQWLYLNHLDSLPTVTRLVAFYVEQHNSMMPHAAFRGQTPDEMYSGTGGAVVDELSVRKREALRRRLERNREVACAACPRSQDDEAA